MMKTVLIILKVTIIACLFYGCCPPCKKAHSECVAINDGKYVKATLISSGTKGNEIGFFRIGTNNKINLIAYDNIKDIGKTKLYEESYIKIKNCGKLLWLDGEAKTKEQLKDEDIILNSNEGSRIRYHTLYQHSHYKAHKRGHILKNISSENDAKTSGTNANGETLYDLDLRDMNGNDLNKVGTYIVYHQQIALRNLFLAKQNTGERIPVHYDESIENPNVILNIDSCHRHGDDIMDCFPWSK